MREKLLVSACLLGEPCRYDGRSCPDPAVTALAGRYVLIPVCPERRGGLPTPRPPAERVGERVLDAAGRDVTESFLRGARETLALARREGVVRAILKSRSPSCGIGEIYDGTFSGTLTEGAGVTAALLTAQGIEVMDERAVGRIAL